MLRVTAKYPMKKTILSLLAVTLVTFVAGSLPAQAQAKKKADAAAESTAKEGKEGKETKEGKEKDPNRKMPFHGKIAEVNKADKTVKVGNRTFKVTATTEIVKSEKPATLDDATVGEIAGGSYKDNNGTLELVKLRIGPKPGAEGKKADATEKKSKKE